MDAPKCKICDKKHWGLCENYDPIGKDVAEIMSSVVKLRSLPAPASNVASNIDTDASNSKQRWDRDKYNAYQREYMRRRRAK